MKQLSPAAAESCGFRIRTAANRRVSGWAAAGKPDVAPVRISYAAPERGEGATLTAVATAKRRSAVESKGALAVGFTHDFSKREGAVSIDGRMENVEDVLRIMSALGRPMNRGWELTGPVSADLHYQWAI